MKTPPPAAGSQTKKSTPGGISGRPRKVAAEVDHEEALEALGALHLDAERLPDPASRAVRCDHPAAGDLVLAAGLEIAHARADAVPGLHGRLPLVLPAGGSTRHAPQGIEQDRLEAVLGEVAQGSGCERELLVALALEGKPAQHAAAELRDPVDVAGLGGRLGGLREGLRVDARCAADLERARVHHVSRGRPLRPRAALDQTRS